MQYEFSETQKQMILGLVQKEYGEQVIQMNKVKDKQGDLFRNYEAMLQKNMDNLKSIIVILEGGE